MSQATQPLYDVITIGNAIRVFIEQDSGKVAAVQCAKSGCAAEFLFTKRQIGLAVLTAQMAWQSTSDCFA